MKKKVFVILGLVALLALAALAGYYYLTQSQSIELSVEPGEKYRIAGKYYEGRYGDRKLEMIFSEMRQLVQANNLKGDLAILYYGNPREERGSVKNFIGILPESGSDLPDSLEVRTFLPDYTITARIHSHPAIMPRPNHIREMMEEKAREMGYELDTIFIEKYLGNEDIVVMHHLSKAGK
ncbi:hypothetical protein AB9P05_07745 [Roseivirga sp. BDSF3-8]|uniref:hypothetical protein n=1 Tax=Roseivirga sp. BDSF3-8 TaxID=3241598 RepID=UPI0035327716